MQDGMRYLSQLSLANPPKAELELNEFLESLLSNPPPAGAYLKLLEQARIPLCFVEEHLARCYTNKPLPLGEAEEMAFQQVVATWQKAARAYAHCAQLDHATNDPEHAQRVALVLHRCIYYVGMTIIEHQRARRELPPGLWFELHGYFASAEEWGVALLALPDALDPLGRSTHCTAAFVSLLLSELAGPYSLSVRDQGLIRRWAGNWAPLVSLHAAVPGETLPPFVVDLMQDCGMRSSGECLQTEHLRRIDTSRLAMQINQVRQQLRRRVSPADIGLGSDCTAGQCNLLLEKIVRPWSQVRAPRKFRRHAASGIARVCTGFEAIHYFISGKEFSQPENEQIYSRQQYERLFAFRHMVEPAQPLKMESRQLGYAVDEWEVVNQSANGFRLMRTIAGKSLAHGQLLAICPHDGERFLLTCTTWLMQEQGGGLVAGIAALPGVPQAIAVRPFSENLQNKDLFSRAILMPAVTAIKTDPSLVIPRGWYHAGRMLEIFTDKIVRIKLIDMLDDGSDYERVSFIAAS